MTNGGERFFAVTLFVPHAENTYDGPFVDYRVDKWLEQNATGTVTITPAAGYEINEIATGNGITEAVKNAHGYDEASLRAHRLNFGQAEGRTFFPN